MSLVFVSVLLACCCAQVTGQVTSDSPLILNDCKAEGARKKSEVKGLECYVPKSHAGYITVDKTAGNHLFFWYFPSQTNPNAPLILWINGGPGLSSMQGLFWQHGPIKINPDGKTYSHREDSLVGPFSVVYVDQPVGVGYSYTDSDDPAGRRVSSAGAGKDLARFVEEFVKIFPQYTTLDVYIGGQSYAGKFIPEAVDYLDKMKTKAVNLKGIFLGGPLFDPETMFAHGGDYAFSMGIISKKQLDDFKKEQNELATKFKQGTLLQETTGEIFRKSYPFSLAGDINNYVSDDAWDVFSIQNIMTTDLMRKALHTGKRTYFPASFSIQSEFFADIRRSTKTLLGKIMNKYKVLIYNGDFDFVVNTNALEAALLSTPWTGQAKYQSAKRSPWIYNGKTLGYFSSTDNLCRVVIHGAGHQAGKSKPKVLTRMLEQFATGGCVQTTCSA